MTVDVNHIVYVDAKSNLPKISGKQKRSNEQ